jgi:hypothetical protein
MTAAAPTAPPLAATPDAALPIQRRSGTLLVGVEGWPGSPDGDRDVSDELLRIADVPVIVVPSHGHPPEDRS